MVYFLSAFTHWLDCGRAQALHKVQREAQERYDGAVAAGVEEEALPPRVMGVCVGTGEAMGIMQGAEGVTCLGWKAGEELARVVASCDIMVAPSEVRSESNLFNFLVYGVCTACEGCCALSASDSQRGSTCDEGSLSP